MPVTKTLLESFHRLVPYRFDPDRHRNEVGALPGMYFLHRQAPTSVREDKAVPRIILALWTGDNPLTANRIRGLESLKHANPETPVALIGPENLSEFIEPGSPLHPMYDHLSLNHRSDYLRAYLMHHRGGGYADIKDYQHSWRAAFETIEGSNSIWVVGYPELGPDYVGSQDAKVRRDLQRRFSAIVGCGAFICRPGTPFTAEWLREVHRRLDYHSLELADHPGGIWGDDPRYPVAWSELGGDVFQPLQLKYLTHVVQSSDLMPSFEYYR